jgi:hypothetical protein
MNFSQGKKDNQICNQELCMLVADMRVHVQLQYLCDHFGVPLLNPFRKKIEMKKRKNVD